MHADPPVSSLDKEFAMLMLSDLPRCINGIPLGIVMRRVSGIARAPNGPDVAAAYYPLIPSIHNRPRLHRMRTCAWHINIHDIVFRNTICRNMMGSGSSHPVADDRSAAGLARVIHDGFGFPLKSE